MKKQAEKLSKQFYDLEEELEAFTGRLRWINNGRNSSNKLPEAAQATLLYDMFIVLQKEMRNIAESLDEITD